VIQTAGVFAGPMAARLLADWGADVIAVEPLKGDNVRGPRDQVLRGKPKLAFDEPRFEHLNRNKRGITLDLSQDDGREILFRLLEKADVFLSHFRPRELEKFRLDYETLNQLNPKLIHANNFGYGKKGPDRDLPVTGLQAAMRSGLQYMLEMPGRDPVTIPRELPDLVGGLCLAYGVMTALLIRERTGVGQEVDASLFQTMALLGVSLSMASTLVGTGTREEQIPRIDNPYPLGETYQTKVGRWLRLMFGWAGSMREHYWPSLCRVIEREDLGHDPRFGSFESREKNHVALFHILEKAFLGKTLDEWRGPLNDAGLRWAPTQTLSEVIVDPQARANDFFIPFDHPTYGHMEVVANPITLSKTPAAIRMPAPELGQHTEEVLLEHGYSPDDIARFRDQHVIA